MLEEVTGLIDRFLFQNQENGYSVFLLQINSKNTETVKGFLPGLQPGQTVSLKGKWIVHSKFGRQFDATEATTTLPNSIIGLKKYLGSGMIKGIGKVYAEKLVDHFGADVLEVIDKFPERLKDVPGIGAKRVDMIAKAWEDQKEISKIMVFLQDKGVSTAYSVKIYKKYGQASIAIVTENPYKLSEDIWGIGFKTADQIAQNLGYDPKSVKRAKAGILHSIADSVSSGGLYVELEELREKTFKLLELDSEIDGSIIKKGLHELHDQEKIKLIQDEAQHFLTLTQYYFSEKAIAHRLKTLLEYPSKLKINFDEVYESIRKPAADGSCLNEKQQLGVLSALKNKVSIVTGGPGTGKTTLIKKLISSLEENKISYRLAAPTGRAAKRIMESTGRHAVTLHRLLEFDFTTMSFAHNENNSIKSDFLIVDETSMIDVFMALAVLKAVSFDAHLLFIGDVDQLPSVGPGNFLKNLIESGVVPTTMLTEIFRQAQDSLIITNAHRINRGEFPQSYDPACKRDFFFIKEEDVENVTHHLKRILLGGLQKFGISVDDACILTPMNRGGAGTQKLNYDLQQILNPNNTEKQISRAGYIFKIGDKVMQIRNNYDKDVYNGDIGIIQEIDLTDKIVVVRVLDKMVQYEFDELDELVLAYAVTVHKSQGSEYAAVIIPIFMQHFTLLQRNLIYTAITRAKRLCIFIGQSKAIGMAVKNTKGFSRKTFLKEFLTTDLKCV
ncbi:MAG: helicase, RecD/TraA family protein [candidate division TM6 bacterium GW2011_GWF2_32_72]|nr:MAG: helicase, RecD/TraA family protein [candidate division TM6 bacterium GW2011_GWF2_32_72]